MPELPEVETIRRGLNRLIVGKTIARARHYDSSKSFPNDSTTVAHFLYGAHITAVRRRAKVLLIDLDTRYTLVVHLKMTGQLVFVGAERWGGGHPTDSLIHELPDRHTRVSIDFTDNSRLFFNDLRKFGWMKLYPTAEVPDRGNYLQFAHVFRRENQPCRRHPDLTIQKIRVAGRGTHICPACQVLPLE